MSRIEHIGIEFRKADPGLPDEMVKVVTSDKIALIAPGNHGPVRTWVKIESEFDIKKVFGDPGTKDNPNKISLNLHAIFRQVQCTVWAYMCADAESELTTENKKTAKSAKNVKKLVPAIPTQDDLAKVDAVQDRLSIIVLPEYSGDMNNLAYLSNKARERQAFLIADTPLDKEAALKYPESVDNSYVYFNWRRYVINDDWAPVYGSALLAGHFLRVWQKFGFYTSPANQEVQGIVRAAEDVSWSFTDKKAESLKFNKAYVNLIVSTSKGWRNWGHRMSNGDPITEISTIREIMNAIEDWSFGTIYASIDAHFVAFINSKLNGFFDRMKRDKAIIGGRAWINPNENTPEELKEGRFTINFDFTDKPSGEHYIYKYRRNTERYGEIFKELKNG